MSRNEEVVCLACQSGFYLNAEKCIQCAENCLRCDHTHCISCSYGYFFDESANECQKCPIHNCDLCKSTDFCVSCSDGYFFNKDLKTCVPCSENCLSCHDQSDNCESCSLKAFRFEEQIVTQKKGGDEFFSGFLGLFLGFFPPMKHMKVTQIQLITHCLKECPATKDKKPVTIDLVERKCITDPKNFSPNLFFGSVHHDDDLHEKTRAFKVKYNEEIEKTKSASLLLKKNNTSPECFNNGLLKREVEADRASYFICKCEEGFMGDNCQITMQLYDQTQKKLLEFLEAAQKQFVDHDHHNKKKFISTLIHISKFRIGHHVIRKIIQLIELFIEIDHEIDNRKSLYLLYDSLLLALYDLLEEIRKSRRELGKIERDTQEKEQNTFELVHLLIDRLESSLEDHKYAHSFLASDSQSYKALDTFSFIISEFKLNNFDQHGVSFSTPNIDTSFNVITKNKVLLDFELSADLSKLTNNIQVIALSSALFADRLKEHKHKPLSNLLYIRFINPNSVHQEIRTKDNAIKSFNIDFALNYLPFFEDIKEHVDCMGYFFSNTRLNVVGEAIKISDDESTLTCQFTANFEVKNYYFMVLVKERNNQV